MTTVLNLSTGEERHYLLCTPREAVIAAYAQSLGDNNTYDYHKYDSLVREGKITYGCGDYTALKNQCITPQECIEAFREMCDGVNI